MRKIRCLFVLRDGAGVCSGGQYLPKSRETRAPLVEELYRFRDRLPEKLRYLADAPQQDPEGNKTMVRFSRKTKQQYVSSEKTERRLAGQHFMLMANGLKGKITFNSAVFYKQRVAKAALFIAYYFSSHLYTKAINDIVVIVSTFLLLNRISHPPCDEKRCSDGV